MYEIWLPLFFFFSWSVFIFQAGFQSNIKTKTLHHTVHMLHKSQSEGFNFKWIPSAVYSIALLITEYTLDVNADKWTSQGTAKRR